MKLKDIHTLPQGWLILINTNYTDIKWIVGKPYRNTFSTWECKIFAINNPKRALPFSAGAIEDFLMLTSDEFIAIPPQDLVKYINHLTEAGAQYLKEMPNENTQARTNPSGNLPYGNT